MACQQGPSLTTAFNLLPLELNQGIARLLDTNQDIIAFSAVCRETNNAINADRGSFWRYSFRGKFALLPKDPRTNEELKVLYQDRCKAIIRGTRCDFFRGHKMKEKDVLGVLRDLIVESSHGPAEVDDKGRLRCNNQDQLAMFVQNSKLLINDRRAPPARNEPSHVHPLLAAIKLVCSHFLFEIDGAENVYGFEESQYVVYQPTLAAPLYTGLQSTDVNMIWMLHCMQFFRNHMMNGELDTLSSTMQELTAGEKPSAWQGPLPSGSYPLSKYWNGTYAYLDTNEIANLRKLDADEVGDHYFIDKNVEAGKIQSLELDFTPGAQPKWPDKFENRLHSRRDRPIPTRPADPAQRDIQFSGFGDDLDDFFKVVGFLNALPPQYGIPGWQRISFMKHFEDDLGSDSEDNLWAYEGVVLPGGRIILGRWWWADDNVDLSRDYNGPFILWAVDEPEIEDEDEE